jgi:hypothetical protein
MAADALGNDPGRLNEKGAQCSDAGLRSQEKIG